MNAQPQHNLHIVAEKLILHPAGAQGERVARMELIQHGTDSKFTEVSFWVDWSNPSRTTRVTSNDKTLMPVWAKEVLAEREAKRKAIIAKL